MIVIISLQSSAFASQREVVKWSELARHLAGKSVVIESMPVVDCPVGINTESARHLVCQVIGNTFYKWKEYEFFNVAGEIRLALEMIKPEARCLTAADAQILLNGSKLWERQSLEPLTNLTVRRSPDDHPRTKNPVYRTSRTYRETMPFEVSVDSVDDAKVNVVPRLVEVLGVDDEPGTRESIQGTDDRVRVTSFATITDYPWNTICYLDFLVAGSSYRGSGTLIAPYCVLTCAHNLWDQDLQEWSYNVTVAPAQYQEFQGGSINDPFGTVQAATLSSNTVYIDNSGGFEYDYGAVKLQQSFSGISTFMPIEYDASPTGVNVVGYPGAVQNESNSYDMWYDFGGVIGYEGTSDRIMLHRAYTSPGQSGSPVWRYDGQTDISRLVAIHVFGSYSGNGACRLISAIEPIISEWMAYSPASYTHFGYIPYLSTSSATSRWTGLALVNYNNEKNSVKIDYYNQAGDHLGSDKKTIEAYGQESFLTATASGTEGWIKVSSTAPLKGLALIGESIPATMFDVDLKASLHRKFLFPHLAVDQDWHSIAMICNPNSVGVNVIYKYYSRDGILVDQRSSTIPANGSVRHDLYTLFQRELVGGSMVVESNQPVTTFILYNSSSITWKAGLSGVSVE